MPDIHAHVAPTTEPTIEIVKHYSAGPVTLVTELEPGEADRTLTVLATLRNAVYDLDVDVAAALALPSIEDLDTLLEQLRAAVRDSRTECDWPSCVTVGVAASGYCPEHSAVTSFYDPTEDEDDFAALEAENQARYDLTPAAHARAALASAIDRDYGGAM